MNEWLVNGWELSPIWLGLTGNFSFIAANKNTVGTYFSFKDGERQSVPDLF